jgi:hypothetical protein
MPTRNSGGSAASAIASPAIAAPGSGDGWEYVHVAVDDATRLT